VLGAHVGGELGLEGAHLGAENVDPGIEDGADLGADLGVDRGERLRRIEERDGDPATLAIASTGPPYMLRR
jgi:hypothetical protein